jgi:hypothetical protein
VAGDYFMDFEIQRCTRHCAKTGRELAPGEVFFSVLEVRGAEVVRSDYCQEAWEGPPEGILGWWKSHMPDPSARRPTWAPNDVMLDLFEDLADQPGSEDLRYVLALLLVRRRVLRMEETERDDEGRTILVTYCARREMTYKVIEATPDAARTAEIQETLSRLLFADAK